MVKFPTKEEFAQGAAEIALDGYEISGKTIREWVECIMQGEYASVVRCKDCKHGEFEQENRMWACVRCAEYDEDFDMFTGFIEYHNEDHFCSYGERRSDADLCVTD